MSEDESMEDSLIEEDEEDDDTSSESVDEELKLTKNFVEVLARIELNKNNYDEYVLLVSLHVPSTLHLHWVLLLIIYIIAGGYRT